MSLRHFDIGASSSYVPGCFSSFTGAVIVVEGEETSLMRFSIPILSFSVWRTYTDQVEKYRQKAYSLPNRRVLNTSQGGPSLKPDHSEKSYAHISWTGQFTFRINASFPKQISHRTDLPREIIFPNRASLPLTSLGCCGYGISASQ